MPDSEPGSSRSPDNPFVRRGPDDTAGDLRILETVVDDVSPELLGRLQDRLAAVGAHHVSVLGVTTKASRPGHLVRVTVDPDDADPVARRLARETGTTGVRELRAAHRFVADTETVTATVEFDDRSFDVAVKLAAMDEEVYDVSAEYGDAARVADAVDRPVAAVMRRAEAAVDVED
ncbi:MAG: nickel insertion protein [Halobacteriaceae archaeon]